MCIRDRPGIVFGGDGAYVAWNIFTDYAEVGSLYSKEVFSYVINRLLDGEKTLSTNLPAQGIATIQEQKDNYVVHLLYANPVSYTHLDVYKRQAQYGAELFSDCLAGILLGE